MKLSQKILAGIAAIAVLAVAGWCIRRDGINRGAIDQRIQTSATEVKELKHDAVVVRAQTIAKRKEYHAARSKVELEGDTVVADGKTVELPSVASLIRVADAHSAQDSVDQAKQDLLVAGLDKRVNLLEEAKRPRCSMKCGVVVGTAGTIAVVYVVVKIIKAVGHR